MPDPHDPTPAVESSETALALAPPLPPEEPQLAPPDRTPELIAEALADEADQAKEAGVIGYFARIMVQVSMPHSRPTANEFVRRNGRFTLTMLASSHTGLPYGTYPRLLLAWLTTQAVRTKSKRIELGDTLRQFMARLDLEAIGGTQGSITRIRSQMLRLFGAMVSWRYDDPAGVSLGSSGVVAKAHLWWDRMRPDQIAMWKSEVVLTEEFFREIVERPVPINMTALKALAKHHSPMAIDIYNWLTYRMSYLKKDQLIPWYVLQFQFGCDYARTRKFKEKFLQHLKVVHSVYPSVRVDSTVEGLVLKPSPSHIPFKQLPTGYFPKTD
jgi:hypothetical protein